MLLDTLKTELRQLLAAANTPSVLARLRAVLSEESSYFDAVFTQSGNVKSLENQQIAGIISADELKIEHNKITNALLKLVDNLTIEDLKTGNVSTLANQIAALKLSPLGKIKLVDCDRETTYSDFKTAYRSIRNLPFQFYFITAQSSAQPANFAERVIYEIIDNTLKGSDLAINFPRKVCKHTAAERVDVPFLPFDDFGDLSDNEPLFRQHFAERMQRFGLDKVPIENLVAEPSTRLPYRFFTFLFRIDFDEWGWTDDLTAYLEWIVRTFKANPTKDPLLTFQFVFIVSSAKNNVSENPQIRAGIEKILRGCNDAEKQPAVWLEKLALVPIADLNAWFLKLTNDQFQGQIQKIISDATSNLAVNGELNMADLEELFFTVYNVSQKID
jgi:hypothetical protein